MELLNATIMGLVEGLTEFLPVSSTGHLILVGSWLKLEGVRAATFEIVIQMGAILAVLIIYFQRFARLLRFTENRGFSGLHGIWLLGLTTLPPMVLGLLVHDWIEARLFRPLTVAFGLAVGGAWILVVERIRLQPRTSGLDAIDWKQALKIGCFQCLALWPGMSRASSTILGGMLSGLDRRTATEYSFFAAAPLLLAAGCFALFKSRAELSAADWPFFAVGLVVSFAAAWLAIKGFIRFVGQHTLTLFGWYRLALALLVLGILR